MTTQLTEPSKWQNPPAPEDWWPTIRAELPAYDTSLHLSEYRADFRKPYHTEAAPMTEGGERRWVKGEELKIDSDDFVALGQAFAEETGLQRQGTIGEADCLLMPQPALIDFGATWLSQHRSGS